MNADAIDLFTGFPAGVETDNPFRTADGLARSLNRARIAALPGVPVEAEILGRTAYELLSAGAVEDLVRGAAGALGLDPADPQLLRAFDRCFADLRTRPAAERVAGVVGRRLGALLLMLVRGDAANRAARPEWNDAHWAYWGRMRRVILGGGLVAGQLGRAMLAETRRVVAADPAPEVELSPYGAHIALVGLARHAPADASQMLLFDFGQTNVKRGRAIYREGALTRIELAPSLLSPCAGSTYTLEAAREQWAAMLPIIAESWEKDVRAAQRPQTAIGLALATHLDDGHPFPTDRGGYGRLQLLGPSLARFLRESLAAHIGPYRAFALLHDGLAAASVCAGQPDTAVLTLGTAIGAGYPPPARGLRPMAPGFVVVAPDAAGISET